MQLFRSIRSDKTVRFRLKIFIALLLGVFAATLAYGQDVQTNVTYLCNGERIVIDSCNIRDTSDTSRCMVGHPDTVLPNGLMKYTSETRGDLKKLLPSCKQPSADELKRAQAFNKKIQDTQEANQKKAEDDLNAQEARQQAQTQAMISGTSPQKPRTPEERAINRCITSGRLPASCTGNALLGAFGQMISSVLPSTAPKEASAGPTMAGVYQGAGGWRLDFIDDGVLVNCTGLSPNQESYRLEFQNDHTLLVIDTRPKPLALTLRADGMIVGPGPVTIDGVVASASGGGNGNYGNVFSGNYHDANGHLITDSQAATSSEVYDSAGNRVYDAGARANASQTVFVPRRATCPALNLSSKGTGPGIQTMETDLLKTAFGGEKGAPTPPGIRMHGIFAASTGFSVQFFPESAILGCGPDAARAYPYTVVADGTKAVIHIAAPDRPLTLAFKPDGSLDPGGAGPYQVHGRVITGQDDNDDFTFAPVELSCELAVLTASKEIPSSGGTTATMSASAAARPAGAVPLATQGAPTGNAVLTILSGFPATQGAPNALGAHPYVLLRDDFKTAVVNSGATVSAGMSPFKALGLACANRTPDCQKIVNGIQSETASSVRSDANGAGVFPAVPPGAYFLMISARYNNQTLFWGFRVELKPGANSVTLDPRNATPLN